MMTMFHFTKISIDSNDTPNYGRRAFCFAGPSLWNSLPEHIRRLTTWIPGLTRPTWIPQTVYCYF